MDSNMKKGVIYALGAYFLWWILPIYWKLLSNVQPFEVLANRFVWSAVFVLGVILCTGQYEQLKTEIKLIFSDKKRSLAMLGASITISINWGVFIWAVNDGRIIETSMGYYINPLVSILLGVLLLGEELQKPQIIAVLCAFAGVSYMVVQLGFLPWVSLVLALSFAFYGYIKKLLPISALTSIFLETILMFPVVLTYIGYLHKNGGTAYEHFGIGTISLMVLSGAVTAIPLVLFTMAARILPLKLVGFTQYIAPSISLLIGILMYNENFTFTHVVSFGLIWLGLGIFTVSQMRNH